MCSTTGPGATATKGGNAIEANLPIDSQAQVTGIQNSNFTSPKELGAILAGNQECQKCVVRQLFRYAFARPETPADTHVIDEAFRAVHSFRLPLPGDDAGVGAL